MKFALTFTDKEYTALNKVARAFTEGEHKFFGSNFDKNHAVSVKYSEDTFCDMLNIIIDRKKEIKAVFNAVKAYANSIVALMSSNFISDFSKAFGAFQQSEEKLNK